VNIKYLYAPFNILLGFSILLAPMPFAGAQTIAEKKAGVTQGHQDMNPELQTALLEVNSELKQAKTELKGYYAEIDELLQLNAPVGVYEEILKNINVVRQRILQIENQWRETAVQAGHYEAYALWHQPETTIGQLIDDYGSQDYVYMVPAEVAGIKLSVDSNIPIPRASWEEMLELILTQNGIGYKQLNPYLRQLYLLKDNKSGLRIITNQRRDLEVLSSTDRIAFVLTPEPAEVRRTWLFLDKFVNPNTTILQMIGRDILVIGQVADIQDLLKLYDFAATNKGDKEYKVFPLKRVDAEEMAKILSAIFDQGQSPEILKSQTDNKSIAPRFKPPSPMFQPQQNSQRQENGDTNGLKVIPLSHVAKALFLVGTKEEIRKAEQIITQVESQVGEAREKIIYWYTTKHTDAEELAEVLQKVYLLMMKTGVGLERRRNGPPGERDRERGPTEYQVLPSADQIAQDVLNKEIDLLPQELYQKNYYQQGEYAINPAPVEPRKAKAPVVNKNRDNFIVDPKTGSIAMVVEADILPKLKDLIKKLDVPKRMVQIEALLFERRVVKHNNYGLNLLKIGNCGPKVNSTCVNFNEGNLGILDFIVSRKATCVLPAYDFIYRFLMTQDDVQINDSPSVVAVNQTPASINIVEEISINTGVYDVETVGGVTLQEAFTRAQYGIWIEITPNIHITEDEEGGVADSPNYVTLETDLTFDSFEPSDDPKQPNIIRRKISNEVSIPDGQTIILGGLRKKDTESFLEAIPFLGELPALGKFFSMREYTDRETEMFILLTPTIISDPLDDFERIKCDEMKRRPGDIPEFMCSMVEARRIERDRVLLNSMDILLGPEPDRCYSPGYMRPSTCGNCAVQPIPIDFLPPTEEYDGR